MKLNIIDYENKKFVKGRAEHFSSTDETVSSEEPIDYQMTTVEFELPILNEAILNLQNEFDLELEDKVANDLNKVNLTKRKWKRVNVVATCGQPNGVVCEWQHIRGNSWKVGCTSHSCTLLGWVPFRGQNRRTTKFDGDIYVKCNDVEDANIWAKRMSWGYYFRGLKNGREIGLLKVVLPHCPSLPPWKN